MNPIDFGKPPTKRIICPVCGQAGKKVSLFTVHSLIKEDFLRMLREDDYFFCVNPDCAVAYYGAFSDAIVEKDRLKTRVGLKEKETPRPVCYCFGHTIEDLHREIRETGKSTAEKDISDRIEAGLCHCEDANPEGRCCLGRVAIAVNNGFQIYDAKKQEQNVPVTTAQSCFKLK